MIKNITEIEADELGYEFELLDDGTYELVKVPDNANQIEIPETYDGEKITVIGPNLFGRCNATSILISDNINKIRSGAFSHCRNLTSIIIDSVVKPLASAMGI